MFMKKLQIVISTLNFHHVIFFLAIRAFPLVRQNILDVNTRTSYDECFENDLGRLKEYLIRNMLLKRLSEKYLQ